MKKEKLSPEEVVAKAIYDQMPEGIIENQKQEIAKLKAQLARLDIPSRIDALEKKIDSLPIQNFDQIDSILKLQAENESRIENLETKFSNLEKNYLSIWQKHENLDSEVAGVLSNTSFLKYSIKNLESKISEFEKYARETDRNSKEILDILKSINEIKITLKKHIGKSQSNPFAPYFDKISDSKHKIESLSTQIAQLQEREIDLRTKSRDVSKEMLRRIENIEQFIAGFKTLFAKTGNSEAD